MLVFNILQDLTYYGVFTVLKIPGPWGVNIDVLMGRNITVSVFCCTYFQVLRVILRQKQKHQILGRDTSLAGLV